MDSHSWPHPYLHYLRRANLSCGMNRAKLHLMIELKYRLTTSPILAFPRFELQFRLACDASDVGLGAVLSQEVNGKEYVIAYASRSLHPPEKKYTVTEREGLALVWATKIFRPHLYGHKFQLVTDHCPLTWLRIIKDPRGRIARWIMTLEEYNWSIVHKRSKENSNVDALSRLPSEPTAAETSAEACVSTLELCAAASIPSWTVTAASE